MGRNRSFGRRYIIQWDAEVARYHVTLGADSIGFHATVEGAKALAAMHARCVTMPNGLQPHIVTVEPA